MIELDISTDLENVEQEIINFISNYVEERNFDGVLVWFSGYIDSTVITKLAIKALSKEAVKILLRLEKYSEDSDEILASSIDFLKLNDESIEKCEIDAITKNFVSKSLINGSLRDIPHLYEPLSYSLLKTVAINEIEGKTYDMIGKAEGSGRDEIIHRIITHNKLTSRIQMASGYLCAETENRALIGTINKTEFMTGLFTKFGRNHCTDLMPLGHLYRTQILQLAEYLEIPQNITSVAKVDLLPGIENKYKYFFDLTALEVDKILVRLEDGRSAREISKEIAVPLENVETIHRYYTSSAYTRSSPLRVKRLS